MCFHSKILKLHRPRVIGFRCYTLRRPRVIGFRCYTKTQCTLCLHGRVAIRHVATATATSLSSSSRLCPPRSRPRSSASRRLPASLCCRHSSSSSSSSSRSQRSHLCCRHSLGSHGASPHGYRLRLPALLSQDQGYHCDALHWLRGSTESLYRT